nr:hybrid signal transduction histidine kinase M [Tanacetum cinerariifolium]
MSGSEVINATPSLSDKLSLVTHHHLLTLVPVKLDLEDWNYGLGSIFLINYVRAMMFLSSFVELLAMILLRAHPLVVARPNTAKEAWDILNNIVKDNKRTRASTLKTEWRSIQLGTLSMEAYFQKIKTLVTTLTSLDCVVNDEDMVHYAIIGIPKKYNQVCGYMHYQNTFSDLKTERSLLVAEEMRLKTKEVALPAESSSPMVLIVTIHIFKVNTNFMIHFYFYFE